MRCRDAIHRIRANRARRDAPRASAKPIRDKCRDGACTVSTCFMGVALYGCRAVVLRQPCCLQGGCHAVTALRVLWGREGFNCTPCRAEIFRKLIQKIIQNSNNLFFALTKQTQMKSNKFGLVWISLVRKHRCPEDKTCITAGERSVTRGSPPP